ncbi:uncharacterized protein [Dermacentor albipictus]|uniref:uncharacterized protein isoform X3 n=1 Tax=Dermacentor albipictus TaxID=60249 RepID=UPI0038FD313F
MSPSESWTDKEDATFPIVPRTSSLSAFGPGFSLRSLVTPSGSRRRRKRLWLHDQIRCGHLLVRRCRCWSPSSSN